MLLPTVFVFARIVTSTPDVMLIAIAVALNTIVEIADAFFDMLAANAVWCVLVAAIAGITPVPMGGGTRLIEMR